MLPCRQSAHLTRTLLTPLLRPLTSSFSRPSLSAALPSYLLPSRRHLTSIPPRTSEDAPHSPLEVRIKPRAVARLNAICEHDKNPNLALRITVEAGGCHGFQYAMRLVEVPGEGGVTGATSEASTSSSESTSASSPELSSTPPTSRPQTNLGQPPTTTPSPSSSTQTEALAPDDTVFEEGGARILMDMPSLELLSGSAVDFTMELIGSQFKIVENPRARSSCGCGTSFDVAE